MFSRCGRCGKKFWFKKIVICDNCQIQIDKDNEIARQKRMEESHKKRMEKRQIAKKKADEILRKQLLEEKENHRKNSLKKVVKKVKKIEVKKNFVKERKKVFDDYMHYESYLLVDLSMKHITVTEWINSKKRVLINRTRELRRTHAGGYSAEKFQKHVDGMKRMTFDWMVSFLEKPDVLKSDYDVVKVVCSNEDLKEKIESWFKKNNYNFSDKRQKV